MFGDNETVVNTAAFPHGKLHKRHNVLSCHKTRHAIAAGVTSFHHVKGTTNPADILSKHWDFPSVWPQLKPILFWSGDAADLIEEDNDKEEDEVDATQGKAIVGDKTSQACRSSSRGVVELRF